MLPARAYGVHTLLDAGGLRVSDCVCGHGRRSPTFAGEFARARVAVILGGAFHVRSSAGDALVGPGALVPGRPAGGYEFRHVDDGGDRSIVFEFDDALVAEIAEAFPGGGRRRGFGGLSSPVTPAMTGAAALAEAALREGDREALQEAAIATAGVALNAADGAPGRAASSLAQARRVAGILRYIEACSAEDCSLGALAARAGLSRFHFLRLFHALTGRTPRQHVIATRLRSAATQLKATRRPVTEIALDVGFGDLSHFSTSFTHAFGLTPRAYRRR